MKFNIFPVSLRNRIILGFCSLILLFLSIMITVEIVGIPGTVNRGKFVMYRAKTLTDMEIVSGLLSQRISSWFKERRIDIDGLVTSYLLRKTIENKGSQSKSELINELNSFLTSHADFESVAIFDYKDASVIASIGNFAGIKNATDIAIGSDKFSKLIIPGYQETIDICHPFDKKPHLRIIRQVFSPYTDKIIAILVTESAIENALRERIWSITSNLSKDWQCIIATYFGGILIQFDENISNNNTKNEFIPEIEVFSPINLAIAGIEGSYDGLDQNKHHVLAFHRQIKIDHGIAMALVLKIDRNIALKPAWEDLYRQFTLWLFMFIAGIGLCIFLAKQISMPINQLVTVARKIESGDLTARIFVTDQSEIGKLGTVFNGMVARLQAWHMDLEKQVFNRTRELQALSARQNAILTAVPDIIMEVDTNKVYTWSNSAGIEFFGKDVIGKEASYYFVGEQQTYKIIKPLFEGAEKAIYIESLQRRKDGEIRLLAWWCKAIIDERDTVIGLLSTAHDITDRKKAEEKIIQSLNEKETLLRELYHRTKNTMQVIHSMLMLQAFKFPTNLELQKLVKDTQDRIQVISLVHQMLYKSRDLSQISIKQYINELSVLIIKSFGVPDDKISLNIKIDDLYFLLDTAIPLGLILNELMTNSLKYAFPDDRKGIITIILKKSQSDKNVLNYSDNGIGFPDGFDFENQSTLGLKLIYSIGEQQMMGKVEMKNANGVSCLVEFSNNFYKIRI
ncbi:MAG: hypothetical protein A2086_06145 [Spirochaetes bacterium GWD1_27_9]|nr:MAG: hypothetical protein A2Z98_16800 [Spirochaetes bacterium GWB1_27_13]OHD27836.1 MAG: hypothetical protein A2Y34_15540 [Spirochaetes bacterium GWC1_27_15]OHD30848.1 MAG: hypothetical protein A2086_06145 [Spirochaetes bacterium GWD1_27_9]